jgi:hypothetical protein
MNKSCQRVVALVAIVSLLLTAGCGSESRAEAAEKSEVTCFTEMTPEQKAQLVEYTKQQPVSETARQDGTQDVCVYERASNGEVTERHSNGNDGFGDYLLYSMLLGHSNAFATIGLISGDLSIGEAMALSLLTGMNPGGTLFHPYSYTPNYGWGRQPDYRWGRQDNGPVDVRPASVRYGNQAPQRFSGKRPAPPKGYAKPKPLPKSNNKVVTIKRGANGKPVIQTVKKANASKILTGKQPVPAVVKRAATTATTIANPSRATATTRAGAATPTTVRPAGTVTTVRPPTTVARTPVTTARTVATAAPRPAPTAAPRPTSAPRAPSRPSGSTSSGRRR